VDRAFDLARQVCGESVLVAGGDYGLAFVADPSPQAGPVAGLVAGAAALRARGCLTVLALAVDAPALTLADLAALLASSAPGAIYEGLPLPMVIEIAAIPADAANDWPLRRLAEKAGLAVLPCPSEVRRRARGANTPEERASLLAHFDGA
jgi:molybdopterin-guanine dinucleotide biosynthesis protein A